ncbi:MAG: hypothetical protein ACRCT8_18070 [Lacipirellulaceae bacterium]
MQSVRLRPLAWVVITVAAFVAGCDSGPPMGRVSGTVALDGKPLKFGSVMFQHTAGGQPAQAQIQPNGSFVLSTFSPEDGARVGTHRVKVSCFSSQDPAVKAAGPAGDSLGTPLIPMRYNSLGESGLSFEVKQGDNEPAKFDLVTDKPKGRR